MKEYKIKINGHEYRVSVNTVGETEAKVCVNDIAYDVDISEAHGTEKRTVAPQGRPVAAVKAVSAPSKASSGGEEKGRAVKSPLPGVVLAICAKEGQSVQRGQKLAVVEAMKMENDILAPLDGVVSRVHVSVGDPVLEGATLITIG